MKQYYVMQGLERGSRLVFAGATEAEAREWVESQIALWAECGVRHPRYELGYNGHGWARLAVWEVMEAATA